SIGPASLQCAPLHLPDPANHEYRCQRRALWMIDQHLGRRSISEFQRGVLALRKREIVAARRAEAAAPSPALADPAAQAHDARIDRVAPQTLDTREAVARAARL